MVAFRKADLHEDHLLDIHTVQSEPHALLAGALLGCASGVPGARARVEGVGELRL